MMETLAIYEATRATYTNLSDTIVESDTQVTILSITGNLLK